MSFEPCEYCGKKQRDLNRGRCHLCDTRERLILQRLSDNTLTRPDTDDVLEHETGMFVHPEGRTRTACDGCGEAIEAGSPASAFTGWDGRTFCLHEACWKILLTLATKE